MTKRAWTLVLALGLCLSTQACGDDDSGDDDSSNDSGSGGSGSGGRSGSSGSGGRSGGAGTSTGRAGSGTSGSGDQDTQCPMVPNSGSAGTNGTGCEGVDEYSQCVQDECDPQDCMDQGCADYFACTQDADDPCMPTGCSPNTECTSCLTDVSTCTLDNCLDLLQCGDTAEGGACDQLDECCADQPDSMRMICVEAARGARTAGGDMLCMTVMGAFCM